MYDLGLINGQIYLNKEFEKLNIYISNGIINKVTDKLLDSKEIIDCKAKLVMPGFIDPHVHLDLNLGEFSSRDDFYNGTKIAALGGVTMIIDFLDPINTTKEFEKSFKTRIKAAENAVIDYSFHTTLGNFNGDVETLIQKAEKAGVPSIKVFTTYKESNRKIDMKVVEELIRKKVLILIHSEKNDLLKIPESVEKFEESRPTIAETTQMFEVASMIKNENEHVYFVHTSSGKTIEKLKNEFNDLINKNIYFESAPQYFYLTKDKFKGDNGKIYLLAPPLRSEEELELLKENIVDVSTIGTDHCSFTKGDKFKYNDISKIPKGIGSIEFSFSLMFNLFGEKIIEKFTENPSKIFKMYPNKGSLIEGTDADIVVFDPNKEFIVDKGSSNSDYSVYEGIKLKGKVETTILRGNVIVKNGEYIGESKGKFIKR